MKLNITTRGGSIPNSGYSSFRLLTAAASIFSRASSSSLAGGCHRCAGVAMLCACTFSMAVSAFGAGEVSVTPSKGIVPFNVQAAIASPLPSTSGYLWQLNGIQFSTSYAPLPITITNAGTFIVSCFEKTPSGIVTNTATIVATSTNVVPPIQPTTPTNQVSQYTQTMWFDLGTNAELDATLDGTNFMALATNGLYGVRFKYPSRITP